MTGKIDPETGQTSYCKKKLDAICRTIARGEASRDEAFALAGVPRRTAYDWAKKFPEAAERIEMAERRRDHAMQRQVADDKWRLARISPKRWGPSARNGDNETPLVPQRTAEDLVREYELFKQQQEEAQHNERGPDTP